MSEEYLPSDVADQVTADNNEVYWNYLHTNDFGPDMPYDDAYGFGAGQDQANVELAGGAGQATMYGETPQGTAAPVPQHPSNDYLQTNFPGNRSFGPGQALEGISSVADQYPYNEDQIWRDHEELSNFQNTARENGQEQLLNNINTGDLDTSKDFAGTEGFPEINAYAYHEPHSNGNVDQTSNLTPARVYSGQPTMINRPGMESAYGNASMSNGRTRGPVLAASNGSGKTPHHSRPGNMQGASNNRNQTVKVVAESSAAMENANNDESDEENQENEVDEDDEEEDVPNHVTFETYEVNDPVIVQNAHESGRGQTGMRNGRQVWFNPRTLKWRMLQLLFPI